MRWEQAMEQPAPPEQIAQWWRRWPDANVGVVTGVASGVAVLDVDPRNGGDVTLRQIEDTWELVPVTAEVRTGGGGRHLWFEISEPVSTGPIGPGLDFKGDGGMVVAPPSVHVSGRTYLWRPGAGPDEIRLAALPAWLPPPGGDHMPDAVRETVPGPTRTAAEQAEFAEAWARAGISLEEGDRYYLCPFHNDHHPSLHVDAEGCRWYCFGCGAGGGIGRLRARLGEHAVSRPRPRLQGTAGRRLPVTLHGTYQLEVVGESHHQDDLLDLTGGRRHYGGVDVEAVAELVPDPHNPYDPNAIAVYIDDRPVGHVRQEDLQRVRPLVEDSLDMHGLVTCRAVIKGGWDRGRSDVGWFGVTLLVPDPDTAIS